MNTPTPYFLPTALYGTKVHCAVPLVPLLEARTLVSIMKNKAAFNPPLAAIKEKYFAKFRGKGKEKVDTPPPATPTSGAGSSGAGSLGAGSSGMRG